MQFDVLQDLQRKHLGAEVGWTPITLARGLTDLGLAVRVASGWRITEAGEAMLADNVGAAETTPGEAAITIVPFSPRVDRTSL
jgi:hypothetical protein